MPATLHECQDRNMLVFSHKINSFAFLQFFIQFFLFIYLHCLTSSQPPSFDTLPTNLSSKNSIVSLHTLCSYACHSFLIAEQSDIALLFFPILYPGFSLCLFSFSPIALTLLWSYIDWIPEQDFSQIWKGGGWGQNMG